MPQRKPPCPPNCPNRKPACQAKCQDYLDYTNLIRKDREAKQDYKASHSYWTNAGREAFKRREKFRSKKTKGELI